MKDKSAVDFQGIFQRVFMIHPLPSLKNARKIFFNVFPNLPPKYHRTFTALTAYYETVAMCNDGPH